MKSRFKDAEIKKKEPVVVPLCSTGMNVDLKCPDNSPDFECSCFQLFLSQNKMLDPLLLFPSNGSNCFCPKIQIFLFKKSFQQKRKDHKNAVLQAHSLMKYPQKKSKLASK